MIVTLTPNPSIDRAVGLDRLSRGEVLRATTSRIDPGGKGLNVSRAVVAMGGVTRAVLPSGGLEGGLLESLCAAAGVPVDVVPIRGNVRMNISVLEPDGTTTKLNEPGPRLDSAETAALIATALADVPAGAWLSGGGSLPPGAPADFYARLVDGARERGIHIAVDTSGHSLTTAVAAGPTLIKPNREELSGLVGTDLRTLGAVIDAACALHRGGIRIVAVSLGVDGAILVTGDGVWHAQAPAADVVSTVAAGDCMLAGLLFSLDAGRPASDALAEGVRWGTAAVGLPGSQVPAPTDIRDIHVSLTTSPDRELPLAD
ncbi:phosphofructokinase [Microbacterium mangrovi]|uniref:1-phosphofructokinase n=1 Tax=Microbacterium mangrovi TaxID=1348253 RepID=A0A0B2A5C5_9MICO|nr:1-phosphofructokinase [Microbacterium mangrovi]KHK98265.1 phosphofructokinase [Microbacterium mangrovi]